MVSKTKQEIMEEWKQKKIRELGSLQAYNNFIKQIHYSQGQRAAEITHIIYKYGDAIIWDHPSGDAELFDISEEGWDDYLAGYIDVVIDKNMPPHYPIAILHRRRIDHYNEWLKGVCTPVDVDATLVENVRKCIGDQEPSITLVRDALKRLRQNKHYEHCPDILAALKGNIRCRPVDLPIEYLTFLYYLICKRHHVVHGSLRSPPSHVFVTRKLLESIGNQEHNIEFFPFIKSVEKLRMQNSWWESL